MICFVNPDGSHVRGCDRHLGKHPAQWCEASQRQRIARIEQLRAELRKLETVEYEPLLLDPAFRPLGE